MKQVPASSSKAIFAYFLVISIDSISFGLIGSILAPLLAHPSIFFPAYLSVFLHYCLYGALVSLFPLTYMIGAPILGILSDRFGRKRILLWCLIVTLFAFVGYAFAFIYKSIFLLILARMFSGLSAGGQGVAQAAVVDFAKQNEKPFFISLIAVGMTMGLIIGPLAASLWTHTASWIPFGIGVFLGLMSITLLLLYVRDGCPISTRSFTKSSLKNFLKKPGMLRLFSLFLLFELGWSLFYQTLPLWLSLHWHLENTQLGLINSYIGALLALSLLLGTRYGLRFVSLTSLIQIGFCFGSCALISLSLPITLPLFFLIAFPIVLTVALIYPGIIAQLSEIGGIEQQGLLMGVSDALLAFSFTVTGIISSLLMYFNSILPFLLAAFFWVIAGLGTITYKKAIVCNSVST